MPRISTFYGIEIYMYYNDHLPPHFHAFYAEYEVIILICTSNQPSSVYAGDMPKAQLKLVLQWADLHCEELMDNWELARASQPLNKVAPMIK